MSQFSLLKKKNFAPLFWTQFLGAFNDNFLKNALVILIAYRVTSVLGIPSSQIVAVAGGIFILPFFLFSATAGQLADKHEKTLIIKYVKLSEIAIMLIAGAGFLGANFALLLFSLFLMGMHSTFLGPVKYSILPQHLSPTELVGGNSLVEAGTFLAILLGTIAGGILVSFGAPGIRIVCVGLFIIAVVGYLTALLIPRANATDPTMVVEWNPVTPTWKMLRLARENRALFYSILGISWFWFFGAAMLSLFPHYCKDVLHARETVVTLFLAIFSTGIGFGSLLCEKLSRKRLELGLVPLGSIGISLFTFDLFLIGAPPAPAGDLGVVDFLRTLPGLHIVADLLAISVVSGLFIVPLYTLIQERAPQSHRSRIIAANNIVNALFMVAASIMLVVLLGLHFTIPQIFLVVALLNGGVAIYIYTLLPEFLFRFIAWMVANLIYALRIEGEDRVPNDGAALLICNHVSFVDWLIIAAAIKRPVHFVMDHAFAKNWLMRRFMKRAKVILIASAKEDPVLLDQAFEQIARDLAAGDLVCIFPEGRITHDGRLHFFHTGVEKILARTPVPVVPMALCGLWGSVFSRRDPIVKRRPHLWLRVSLKIGAPIDGQSAKAASLQQTVATLGGLELAPPPKI